MKPQIYIGIDTGVNTGVAVWDVEKKKFLRVETMKIHEAFELIKEYELWVLLWEYTFKVRVEDARQRKWFGKADKEQLQGAGSIKRDAKIWEDFLTAMRCEFEMVAPKNNMTKLDAKAFEKMTGWKGRTSEHARDAAMLVYGF